MDSAQNNALLKTSDRLNQSLATGTERTKISAQPLKVRLLFLSLLLRAPRGRLQPRFDSRTRAVCSVRCGTSYQANEKVRNVLTRKTSSLRPCAETPDQMQKKNRAEEYQALRMTRSHERAIIDNNARPPEVR